MKCLKEALCLLPDSTCWADPTQSEPGFLLSVQSWRGIQQSSSENYRKTCFENPKHIRNDGSVLELYKPELGPSTAVTSLQENPSCVLGLSEVHSVLCADTHFQL